MRIIRGFAAAVILACAALGFAGPAQADQVVQGIYTYTPEQGQSGDYQIYPSCVPVVGDLREPLNLPVACRLHTPVQETSHGHSTHGRPEQWTRW